MRRLYPLLLLLVLSACTPTLTPQQQAVASEQQLLRLVRISLTERLQPQIEASYRQQVMALLPADPPPSETTIRMVDEEIDGAMKQKISELEERLAAIFSARFTPDEIRQLVAFHESEVGRKSHAESAAIAGESRDALQQWSQGFEQVLFERLTDRFSKEGLEL